MKNELYLSYNDSDQRSLRYAAYGDTQGILNGGKTRHGEKNAENETKFQEVWKHLPKENVAADGRCHDCRRQNGKEQVSHKY